MREENQIREKGGGNRIKIHGRIYTPAKFSAENDLYIPRQAMVKIQDFYAQSEYF